MIHCIKFRSYRKNTLLGFADLELTRVGLVLRECPWHQHPNGKTWIAFPARPYTGADGVPRWQPLAEFSPGADREEFQRQVRAAIDSYIKQAAGAMP